jgi:hypothetical protein
MTDPNPAQVERARIVARECPYNHQVGTRCPNCARWPYKKGGAAAYTERVAIVAWLRKQKLWTVNRGFLGPKELADAIERGDHTNKENNHGR